MNAQATSPMSAQEIFDKVANHLRTQRKRCIDRESNVCAYRGGADKNLSCAIGCLIPDSEYTSAIEGNTIAALLIRNDVPASIQKMADDGHIMLLADLQRVHDAYHSVEEWNRQLRLVALNHKLEYKE